jgi:hypothetical protein
MALVLSTDLETVRVQSYGNWFEFKPNQIKQMQDHIADFLCTDRRDKGFVVLPESYDDDRNSPENKKIFEAALATGRANITRELNRLRVNFEVSTQKDIDVSGEKRSFMSELTSAHKEMYRRLALFKKYEQDIVARDEDEVRKYMDVINGNTSSPDTAKADKGNKDISKSA